MAVAVVDLDSGEALRWRVLIYFPVHEVVDTLHSFFSLNTVGSSVGQRLEC